MPNDDKQAQLMTIAQLAKREEMTERQIRYLISAKGLPCYKTIGIRVRYSEYLSWLEDCRVQ